MATVLSASLITFHCPNFHSFFEKKIIAYVISSPMAQSGTVVALVAATLTTRGSLVNASLYVGDLEENGNEGQLLILIHVHFKITNIKRCIRKWASSGQYCSHQSYNSSRLSHR
ncbi:hypothetical protein P8452_67283 [Trifolium repens]|nr:hypothetical protein P8452_67283 [Trifolium repens]